jgi:two-component system, OmpR family, response regulator
VRRDPLSSEVSVLLVEDDPSLREAIERCLSRAGFLVTAAKTGADALEAARSSPPNAAVIDVLLPDAGGLGVAREMRRQRELESIPILFITALSLPMVRDALSPAPVLFKPFTQRQLLASLREITRES